MLTPFDQQGVKFIFKEFELFARELDSPYRPLSSFQSKVLDLGSQWLSTNENFEFETSGSTGSPRKIIFNRRQIQASVKLTKQAFELREGQNALLCLDPGFVAGKMMIIRALEIGLNLFCVSPTADPLEALPDQPMDFAAVVPYQLDSILKSEASTKKLNKIKTVLVGGSTVSGQLVESLQPLTTQFFETYGMTETLSHIAIRKLNPPVQGFYPLPGISVFEDERSCLNIQAPHLGRGPIRTNDVVDMLDTGAFNIVGRFDNIINSGGMKISPEEVERKISTIMSNNLHRLDYFIGSKKDEQFGERVTLFIESNEIDDDLKHLIIELFRPVLKKWEIPREVVCLTRFKRTSSGKVNRTESIRSVFEP